jgi:hypothetical protein
LLRNGAVGFIDWLDVCRGFIAHYRHRQKNPEKLSRHHFDRPEASATFFATDANCVQSVHINSRFVVNSAVKTGVL